jgi:hypothetical protein
MKYRARRAPSSPEAGGPSGEQPIENWQWVLGVDLWGGKSKVSLLCPALSGLSAGAVVSR